MKLFIVSFCVLLAAPVFGQKSSRSTWQDRCFNNPAAPYCSGRDFAVKPTPTGKDGGSGTKGVMTDPVAGTAQTYSPSVIVVGGIDWRFADPSADVLLGFNVAGLASSPLARNLITQLGTRQNLTETDVKKIFDGLSGVDQIGVSVRDNKMVAMITGGVTGLTAPAAEVGMKTYPVSGNSILFGAADAVDQAVQRITSKGPLSDLAQAAGERQASSEFWAIGSGIAMGQQVDAGVKRFSLMVSIRNRLTSDVAFEFNAPPSAKTLSMLPGAEVYGNVVHAKMSMDANEVPERFREIAASPAGERLAILVEAARHFPARDTTAPKQTKPVIFGLEGGPKVVGQPDK